MTIVLAATRSAPARSDDARAVFNPRAGPVRPPTRPQPVRAAPTPTALARRAGITAVWTHDYSGTVELARLAGPRDSTFVARGKPPIPLPGRPPWRLSQPNIRILIYQYCLTKGTRFEIYRWVNLSDLAAVWPELALPQGLREEWQGVLVAAGLATVS